MNQSKARDTRCGRVNTLAAGLFLLVSLLYRDSSLASAATVHATLSSSAPPSDLTPALTASTSPGSCLTLASHAAVLGRDADTNSSKEEGQARSNAAKCANRITSERRKSGPADDKH